MNVFLSAYACHPNRGSEPGVGWNWLKELSKDNIIWAFIYSEQGQKKSVDEKINLLPHRNNIHIVPITVPKFFQHRLYRIRYEIWQWKAYHIAKKLKREIELDLIHHVTLASWWNCGHLWKLNVPFIFGPISGAQQTPEVGLPFLRTRDRIYEKIRILLFNLSWRLWQRPKLAMKKAIIVLVANPETEKKVKKIRKKKPVILFPEIGVDKVSKNYVKHSIQDTGKQINLFWVGLLIARKNFGLLLEALAGLSSEINWVLRVAGEGNLLEYWKKNAEKIGLQKHISFLGKVSYSQMSEQYRWANVLVFPSLREATGTVILESMSYGIPVIAFKIHGASVVLDDSCAILVSVINKQQMIRDFKEAIIKLYRNPQLRTKMGEAGRKRVLQNYLWEKRGVKMNAIYKDILSRANKKSQDELLPGY